MVKMWITDKKDSLFSVLNVLLNKFFQKRKKTDWIKVMGCKIIKIKVVE